MKNLNNCFFNSKVKTKSLTVLLVTFLLSTSVGTIFVGEASAAIDYTEYTGTLDGGDWALRIPDPWNGMLVIVCRGYSATDPGTPTSSLGWASSMLNSGFAVAASNYGSAGWNVKQGVSSSYELTMYIIENYDVTGKVFLYGMSMGGGIVLLLGEKYPEVYSGVLELYGVKDLKVNYNHYSKWATMSDEELGAELTAIGAPIPPFLFSLQSLRNFYGNATINIEIETGGTPITNPQAYEDQSPTYHADIKIPVITVHGTADALVLYVQALLYQNAVAKAGRSSLYRLYTVTGGQHVSSDVQAEVPGRFNELVEWSNELTNAHDWPMFGYDAQRSGYSTSNAPNTNQTLWTYTTGGWMWSSPAVVDGKVYVGSDDTNVYCLDAANGAQIWNYTTGGWVRSSPAVAEGKVYFGTDDDNVYCLVAMTGAKIWSYKTGDDIASSPVVAKGKVYVGSNDGKLYCLRADYGQVVWKFTTGDNVYGAPAVADGKVYVGSRDNNVYCLDAATSALIWSYTTGDWVLSSPAVADGRVYVGSRDNNVYCLDAETGAKIWSYTTGSAIDSCPSVACGKLYVGSIDRNLYCLDPATGELIWNYSTGISGAIIGSPTVADGKVYVGSWDRNIYCLDAATGAFIWSHETGGQVFGSPVVANGVAYATSNDGIVYAFSAWEPIPEGSTTGVMLLLSTIAVVVSARYFRKRREWENW